MAGTWVRSLTVNENNSGYYGSVEMLSFSPDSTLNRSIWSINLWGTWGNVAQYPPGSSICRAGIIVAESGLDPSATPTPISQPTAPWVDLVTLVPVGQIAISTLVDWQYNWVTPVDRIAKAMRRNDTSGDVAVYLSWEFSVASDALSGFAMLGWSGAVDAYILSS